ISGAKALVTFIRIVVPLVAPALVTCWLFIFLMASKAVSIPILLAGPDSQVVAVAMFSMWQNGVAPELAALGVIWTVIMTIASTLFFMVSRRYGLSAREQVMYLVELSPRGRKVDDHDHDRSEHAAECREDIFLGDGK